MKARYKYRIYPNDEQKIKLAQLFGCCRYVWNQALAHCNKLYIKKEKKTSNSDLQKLFITQAKRTILWLKEVASTPLQQSLNDLDVAYKNFFDSLSGKRKGPKLKAPKFKSRKSRQSARFVGANFKVEQHKIELTKVGKIKIVWSRPLPSKPSSATIIKDAANRYFISFVVETQAEPLEPLGEYIGIDLGITTFATLSNGEKIEAPKPLKKNLKKLKRFQRNLSRCQKGSKRREKARLKVGLLHTQIKEIRDDFLHKLSTRLIRENPTIILEDLNVYGMVKNRKLSRAISDLGWRTFRTMLEYKANKYGRKFQVINRWEPTSQKCSHCGFNGGKKELGIREWICLNCGTWHDRDVNAAVNILNAGNTILQPITEPEPVLTPVIIKQEPTSQLLNTPVQLGLFQEVAEGQPDTVKKRTSRRGKSTRKKVVRSNEMSTLLEFCQQRRFV
ncbi:MAG: RNA-guided endonuclease TnpB family protein [Cyanobacteriota bacterium]|nr:RNA-guided endonuclease TnpB family protein [Cyanobacteriota bacterium]